MIAAADDHAAHQPEHQDAEKYAHQADVQAHVTVEDVAEFMRYDALQFVSAEEFQRAARDGDCGIARRKAGSECVDAAFLLEHVDFRDRDARRDCHLLDDIAQTPSQRIHCVCGYQCTAHLPCNLASPRGEKQSLVNACADNQQRRQCCGDEQWHRIGGKHFARRVAVAVDGGTEERKADNQRHAEHDQRCGDEVNYDKPARGLACPVLRVKEIQCLAAGCQVKETSGTSRFSSDSISRKLASSKRNIPATILLGKFSAVLL